MIPQIIHYCWFGHGKMSDLSEKCIQSWKEKLPEYEIMRWDENNFDVEQYRFSREAYRAGKYAFVADVARLHVLNVYGGIYFDTDVEVVKSLDEILDDTGFGGMEEIDIIACGILGADKGNAIIREFLEYYRERSFYTDIGNYDMVPNPVVFTNLCRKYGFKNVNKQQRCGCMTIYPMQVFCPKSNTRLLADYYGEETLTIHHYEGSWVKDKDSLQLREEEETRIYVKLFGQSVGRKVYRNVYRLKKQGILYWFKFIILKLIRKR